MRAALLAAALLAALAQPPAAGATYLGEVRSWPVPGWAYAVLAVDVGPDGTVYALGNDRRLSVYTPEGLPIRSFETHQPGDSAYGGAQDLAVDASGQVLYLSGWQGEVRKVSLTGDVLARWPIDAGYRLAAAADGGVWVSAYGDRALKLSPAGDVRARSAVRGGPFAADRLDRIFAGAPGSGGSHTPGSAVSRFDPGGTETLLPLRYGSKPGQIGENFSAEGIDVDPTGNVWINDRPNRRIQAFTPDGRYILGCGSPRTEIFGDEVGDIAVAPSGTVYVVDGNLIREIRQVAAPAPACAAPPLLRITGLRARPARFRIATGTRLHFFLSKARPVWVAVYRRLATGRLALLEGRDVAGRAGLNIVRLDGRYRDYLKRRAKLASGAYETRVYEGSSNGLAGDVDPGIADFRVIH